MAREVADATGTLMGGNICNTGVYDISNPDSIEKAKLINKVKTCHLIKVATSFVSICLPLTRLCS